MSLNFPDPAVTQTYTEAGITWTWNAGLGVWSSDTVSADADDLYLSKVNDDTAAGAITFEGLTTHEGGVSVTGGDKDNVVTGFYSDATGVKISANSYFVSKFSENGIGLGGGTSSSSDVIIRQTNFADKNRKNGLFIDKAGSGDGSELIGAYINLNPEDNATIDVYGIKNRPPTATNGKTINGNIYAYSVDVSYSYFSGDASTNTYGFYSNLIENGNDRNNYNFYAEGTAPNYFAGNITCDGLINGAFSLRMETDDPAAFQTAYTTDDEGNQVEQQEYIGTTEDLLSIIKDLRARVAALEAG